uniref:Uncharacterized protein n=1 Tax=Rhipicephalus zambeziensis TaxID=60191 RepID=A0A224YLQ4_9ACAR
MLIVSPPKRGSSNASSVRIVCLQFLQVCSRSDSLAMTLLRCSHLYDRCEADCIADGSTLSSHWAEQKHLAPEESCLLSLFLRRPELTMSAPGTELCPVIPSLCRCFWVCPLFVSCSTSLSC